MMIKPMKRRLFAIVFSIISFAAVPTTSLAQTDPDAEPPDARFVGYPSEVILPSHSGALTWVLFLVMTIFGLGVLFKNSKRTHLD
jgi:hypothetical protein